MKKKLLAAVALSAASMAAFACPGMAASGEHASCPAAHDQAPHHCAEAGHSACGGRASHQAAAANSLTQWQAMAHYVAAQIAPQLRDNEAGWAVSLPEEGSPTFAKTFGTLLTSSLVAQGVPMAKKVDGAAGVVEIKLDAVRFADNLVPPPPSGLRTGATIVGWALNPLGVVVSGMGAASAGIVALDVWQLIKSKEPEPNAELAVTVTAAKGNILKASASNIFLVYTKDKALYTPSETAKLPTLSISDR